MTSYAYNRQAFQSGSSSDLASTYCRLVQLELALKEELGLINCGGNGGHNVPALLTEYGNTKVANGTKKISINSAAAKMGSGLAALWCQGRHGTAVKVPKSSYPYMRYVRHNGDGWPSPSSTAACVVSLRNEVNNVIAILKSLGVVL